MSDQGQSPYDPGGPLDPRGPNSPQLNPRSPQFRPSARAAVARDRMASPLAPAVRHSDHEIARLAELEQFRSPLLRADRCESVAEPRPISERKPLAERVLEALHQAFQNQLPPAVANDSYPVVVRSVGPAHQSAKDNFADPLREDLESARRWLGERAPRALAACEAASKRLAEATTEAPDAEALSQAVSSLRRAFGYLADAVFPARDEPWTDSQGRKRSVGPDEFKNRLLAFFDTRLDSSSSREDIQDEIELTAHRFNSLVRRLGAGVHSDLSPGEVRRLYGAFWSVATEVARLASV